MSEIIVTGLLEELFLLSQLNYESYYYLNDHCFAYLDDA